jgi:hypothetical protein
LILLTAALAGVRADEPYRPLTPEEAANWINSISDEELIQFVIDYDYVEHVDPVLSWPPVVAVLDRQRNLHVYYDGPIVLRIGHLEYELETRESVIEEFEPPRKYFKWAAISGGVGVGLGLLVGILIE